MSFECDAMNSIAHSTSLVTDCDVVRSGRLRLMTPFQYPDGSNVDVFLERAESLFCPYILSDCGQTWLYLEDFQVKPHSTSRRREIVKDICSSLGVTMARGVLSLEIPPQEATDVSSAIMRLSQACIRISDLASHQRLRSLNAFRDDIEEFMDASGLTFIADQKVSAEPYEKEVRIDFEVTGEFVKSFVMALGSVNEPAAHSSANEIFRKWHLLKQAGFNSTYRFVTIFNSTSNAVNNDDIKLLSEYSDVVSYPEQEEQAVSVLNGKGVSPLQARLPS